MARSPTTPRWVLWIVAVFIAELLICATIAIVNRSLSTFLSASLMCGLPLWLLIAAFIVLANAGKRARTYCGFCGYDRTGLSIETLCPECGKDGTSLTAPGHAPVGKRPLPIWVWLPILLAAPILFVVGRVLDGQSVEYVILGSVGILVGLLLLGAWHAWKQAG